MYLLALTFALGYLSGQLPLPFQALAATVAICLLSTSRAVPPSTPPADEHYGRAAGATAAPLDLEAIYDAQEGSENRRDQQAEQSLARGRTPRQHEHDGERTVRSEDVTKRPYERQSREFQLPRGNREATPPDKEPERSPLLSHATSPPATAAPTEHHRETRDTEMGRTEPSPPRTFGCDQGPPAHETTERPGTGQASTEPHRSRPIEHAGMEHHRGHAAGGGQGGSPACPRSLEDARPQAVGARLTGVTEGTGAQQGSSLPSSSSEEMEVSQQSTDITTPGIDGEQDKYSVATEGGEVAETTDDVKDTDDAGGKDDSDSNSGGVDMTRLLRTSNRLLEDGRQLLADGMRQPRRAAHDSVVGDEGGSNREGWYPHDI